MSAHTHTHTNIIIYVYFIRRVNVLPYNVLYGRGKDYASFAFFFFFKQHAQVTGLNDDDGDSLYIAHGRPPRCCGRCPCADPGYR